MATPEPLGVWLDGMRVAEFRARKPWDLRCAYTSEALDRWPGLSPLLSCSLPLQSRLQDASVFASGLLPEGQHRQALAADLKVAANDTYSLLRRFGRDVAGALVIDTDEPANREGGVEPYTQSTLETEIEGLPDRPLGIHDDSELSLAGLQDKLLLVALEGGGWGRPLHGRASTHILKLDDRRHPGLIAAEAACLGLARRLGLTTVEAQLEQIAGVDCLIVSRFDRRVGENGDVDRIHQEDSCQALARDPEANRGRGKYESAGGPSLMEIAGLLDRYAADPASELERLVAVVTFTILIGNADAHGKNLSLLHPTAENVEFAPLYDTVPTMLWPGLRDDVAMSVNHRWKLASLTIEDVANEAARWRLDASRVREVASATVEELAAAVDELEAGLPLQALVKSQIDHFIAI
jgi:serine/threonine-protein kinase HipA